MKYIKILLFLIVSLYCPLHAGTIDPSISDTKYLEYGSKFDCVVRVGGRIKEQDKNLTYYASGVIIDDHHILTAAHVAKDCYEIFVIIKDKEYVLSKVIIHEDFDNEFGRGDIAIAYTEESFKLDFYPELYCDQDEVGKVCSISGYGLTGNFISGSKTHDNKKRAGSNIIDKIEKDLLICSPSRRNTKGFTSLEFFIASGDSGGGLFVDGKLAGINSCIMADRGSPISKYGEESGHTRVSKFIDWIKINKIK